MEDDAELMAAYDAATGEFVDLVMAAGGELYFRSPHESWEAYQPGDQSLDGKEVIDVDESFIRVADRAFAARTAPAREEAARHAADDGQEAAR